MTKDKIGLCYRCEHRAKFLETGAQPRCECGEIEKTNYSCYMYIPVKPVIVAPNEGDIRPLFGPTIISGRCHVVDIPEMELTGIEYDNGVLAYWNVKKEIEDLCSTCKFYSESAEFEECDQCRHNPVFENFYERRKNNGT